MRLGVLSDTHGLLRPEALVRLEGVDHVVHAGDVGDPAILEALRDIAPVTAVRGNVDRAPAFDALPDDAVLHAAGRTVYVLHDAADLSLDLSLSGVDLFVFGHSHKPLVDVRAGVVHLNPGSAGPRRFRLPVTLAMVDLAATDIVPEIHTLVG